VGRNICSCMFVRDSKRGMLGVIARDLEDKVICLVVEVIRTLVGTGPPVSARKGL
jgi:hypothetical protein